MSEARTGSAPILTEQELAATSVGLIAQPTLWASLRLPAVGARMPTHDEPWTTYWATRLDPTRHAYDAIVWVLVLWASLHNVVGALMQLYCLARSFAGRLTRTHDIDLRNVVLYWHFAALTALVTGAVIALFPLAN